MRYTSGILLGSLLFIINLNDFEGNLQYLRASTYADDTNVITASDDIQRINGGSSYWALWAMPPTEK